MIKCSEKQNFSSCFQRSTSARSIFWPNLIFVHCRCGHVICMCLLSPLVVQRVEHLPAMWETWFDPWVGKILWRRKWQPTPVPLPGKSHGPGNPVGYSPWDGKESDMTERLHFHCPRVCVCVCVCVWNLYFPTRMLALQGENVVLFVHCCVCSN